MGDQWVAIEALSGEAKFMEGKFIPPETYYNQTAEKEYTFVSDAEYLELDVPEEEKRVILMTNMLSRDVHVLPSNFEKVDLKSPDREIQRLPNESRGIWFHISPIALKQNAKKYFKQKITKKTQEEKINSIGESQAFQDEFSLAYLNVKEKPKVRFHSNINSLIASYKRALQIKHGNVVFRIYGTTRYKLELMYTVLICPPNCNLSDEKFPRMTCGESCDVIRIVKEENKPVESHSEGACAYSDGGETSQDSDEIFNESEPQYHLEWKPYSTGKSDIWDNVSFIFYLPPKARTNSLGLDAPYYYQIHRQGRGRGFQELKKISPPGEPLLEVSYLVNCLPRRRRRVPKWPWSRKPSDQDALHKLQKENQEIKGDLRRTRDELRLTRDELRLTRDELRLTRDELRLTRDELRLFKIEMDELTTLCTQMEARLLQLENLRQN